MKAGLTLPEIAMTLTDLRARVRDFRVPQNALLMNPETLRLQNDPRLVRTEVEIAPTPLMHEQIAERLGIPFRYYSRMQTETPDLLAANVNRWLGSSADKRFLRTYAEQDSGGSRLTGRAFLGSTYRPLDNYDLIAAVSGPMIEAGVEVESAQVTERRLYVQAVARHIKSRVVVPGAHDRIDDILNIGVVVSNSEVGAGSLSVRALVYRQVCTNGLVVSEDLPGFKQVHIGGAGEGSGEEYLSTATRQLRDAAIWARTRDVIRAAISQATLDKVTAKINEAAGVKLANPEGAVDLVVERYDLTNDERAGVMRNLIEGADVSKWGLVNAVTALANTAENYDRAVELETVGGKILALGAETFGRN